MKIKLFNTLGKEKQIFKPLKKGYVGIYTCGPTVYWYQHIGNLRAYFFADTLKRMFLYNGYQVKHIINITDVGHLTSDADTGEDKMEKGARREGKTARQVARMYEKIFKNDLETINVLEPNVWAKATEHIKEQVLMVCLLEQKGYTYKTSDGIYFDTSKIKNYGELTNLVKQKILEGARVEKNPQKKNPTDFALWKFETPGKKRQMVWHTPWGLRTFPGWHIECSAMSIKYLGEYFDIHTGGIDHIGVHHTNEIAQNQAATGHKVVNYWLHLEHLLFGKSKMAKSAGGVITIETLINKKFDPISYRYLLLTAHYHHKLNFSWKSLKGAQNTLYNLRTYIRQIYSSTDGKIIKKYKDRFLRAINDDLDTPKALTFLWELVKSQENPKDICATVLDFDRVFGLELDKIRPIKIPQNIKEIAKKMDQARDDKDYKLADKLRKQIVDKGYIVKNTDKGSVIEYASTSRWNNRGKLPKFGGEDE